MKSCQQQIVFFLVLGFVFSACQNGTRFSSQSSSMATEAVVEVAPTQESKNPNEVAIEDSNPIQTSTQTQSCGSDFSQVITVDGSGDVWGSQPFTVDSNLSSLAKFLGYSGKVEVSFSNVRYISSFSGSTKNSVTTLNYGGYCGGQVSIKAVSETSSGGIYSLELAAPVSLDMGSSTALIKGPSLVGSSTGASNYIVLTIKNSGSLPCHINAGIQSLYPTGDSTSSSLKIDFSYQAGIQSVIAPGSVGYVTVAAFVTTARVLAQDLNLGYSDFYCSEDSSGKKLLRVSYGNTVVLQ